MLPFHLKKKEEYFTSNGFGNASWEEIKNGRDCPVFHLHWQILKISSGLKSLNPGIISAEKSHIVAGDMQDM